MDRPLRPRHLEPGATVAVVSPSWGGPAVFPGVFDHGLAVLRGWGLEVREYGSTRAVRDDPARSPRRRAEDLNSAFGDPTVHAIITSIGGDDSIRLLPYLDAAVIRANPKILMGYSDTTVLLSAVRRMGLVTFHGPSVMAGLSQLPAMPEAYGRHVRSMLFEPATRLTYAPFGVFVSTYPRWEDPRNAGRAGMLTPDDGPRVLQGAGQVVGELFGGCVEVLDWIRGTSAWPTEDEWSGRLLIIEPSEEKPSPDQVTRILRSFGALGVFDRIAGLLVGRAMDHTAEEKQVLESAIRDAVAGELGRPDLPILANLDIGHSDPQWVIPIGVRAEVDLEARTLTLLEPWLT